MGVNGTYGLSGSGLDVDEIVKKLMAAKKTPYTKMYQDKTRAEWKKADYNSIYTAASDYRNEIFSFKLPSNLGPKKVTVSGDTKAVSASATADAVTFNHQIEVKAVAQSSSMASLSKMSFKEADSTGALVEDKNLKLTSLLNPTGSGASTTTIPPEVKLYKDQQAVVSTALDAYNAALRYQESNPTDIDGIIDVATKRTALEAENQTLKTLGEPEIMRFDVSDGKDTKTISLTAADLADGTIYDFESKINKSGLNIKADYDKNLGRFFLYSSKSGTANQITIEAKPASSTVSPGYGNGKDFLENLKLIPSGSPSTSATTDSTRPGNGYNPAFTSGSDAWVIIDGMDIHTEENNITVGGITYTANAVGTAKVQVNSDIDKTVENVKSFVESYNKMLEAFNKKNGEKYYKDYAPLTDEQKENMSEDAIKQWEQKAKSGMLYHDSILKGLISDMRSSVTNIVTGISGKYNSAFSLGISTKSYQDGGKLYLNEETLRQALSEDPDCVSNVFGTDGATNSAKGIGNRLYTSLKETMDELNTKAGVPSGSSTDTESVLAKQIERYTKKMTAMEKRLDKLQKQYYKKFDRLEVSFANLTSQNSWLFNQ